MTTQPPACGKISELAPCPFCGATDSESLTGLAIHHKHGCFLQKRIGSTYLAASEHAAWNLRQPSASPAPVADERLRQLRTAVLCMPLDDSEARDLLAIIDAYRHPAPVADERALLREIDEYLGSNQQNSIWSGSKLHQSVKAALSAQPSGALEPRPADAKVQEFDRNVPDDIKSQPNFYRDLAREMTSRADRASLFLDAFACLVAAGQSVMVPDEQVPESGVFTITAKARHVYAFNQAMKKALNVDRPPFGPGAPPQSSSPSATADATSSVAIATLQAALRRARECAEANGDIFSVREINAALAKAKP